MKKRGLQKQHKKDASGEPKRKVLRVVDTEKSLSKPIHQDLLEVLIQNGASSGDLQEYRTHASTPAWFYKEYRSLCGTILHEVDIISHRKKKYVEALEQYHEEKAKSAYLRDVLVNCLLESTNLKPNFILEHIIVKYVGNDVQIEPTIGLDDTDWGDESEGTMSPWSPQAEEEEGEW